MGSRIAKPVSLLPAGMTPGDSVIVDNSWKRTTITYLENEPLMIGKIMYSDCIKLKIVEQYDDTMYLSYVWLQKGIGMVKWMRATGKIEVLVRSF